MLVFKFICVLLFFENGFHKVQSFPHTDHTSGENVHADIRLSKEDIQEDDESLAETSNDDETFDETSGDYIKHDDDRDKARNINSSFKNESNCRILYALGVKLDNLGEKECLKLCFGSDSCKSVSYKAGDKLGKKHSIGGSICHLNTEKHDEAGPFYQCQGISSRGWEHYEKRELKKRKHSEKKALIKSWRDGKQSIKELKKLRKSLLASGKDVCNSNNHDNGKALRREKQVKRNGKAQSNKNLTKGVNERNFRFSKRTGCFEFVSEKKLKKVGKDLNKLLDPDHLTKKHIDVAQSRYGKLIDQDRYRLWKEARERSGAGLPDNELDTLEMYSVYKYTDDPAINQVSNGLLYGVKELKDNVKQFDDSQVKEIMNQGILMQDYLKKNAIEHGVDGTKVYRFELEKFVDKYEVGTTYVDKTMLSTTKRDDVKALFPSYIRKKDPIRIIEIKLTKSGTDISSFSKFPHEEEVLVPFGTEFRVISREAAPDIEGTPVTKIILEEV